MAAYWGVQGEGIMLRGEPAGEAGCRAANYVRRRINLGAPFASAMSDVGGYVVRRRRRASRLSAAFCKGTITNLDGNGKIRLIADI